MLRYFLGAFAALMVLGTAHAADPSPTDVANRHMAAVAKADVDAIMADYADDAILMQAGEAFQGKVAIRAYMAKGLQPPSPGAPSAAAAFKVTRVWEEGNVVFVTWQMGPINGVDDFLVRNGKIQAQGVFMSGTPQPAK